ncbi:MAG TPA: Os1348 family NHLP clan protein [Vicinamibacterales bacterium]|jgi:hypothetical protein
MSQRTVQLVIGRLVTDEVFRARFIQQPTETLTDLSDRGLELTRLEVDALARTDRKAWDMMAKRLDSRLQRCRLVQDGE